MARTLTLPHRPAHAMCIVNGIRDLIEWRTGQDWSNAFVYGLGQGSGFAYLRIKAAAPPRQVYWGISTPRQHEYLAQILGAQYTVTEDRSFAFAWNKACAALEAGLPPVLGPLDMFHLPYYEGLYHKMHIPIHYVLLVGYDDRYAYVHDTDKDAVLRIPGEELQLAWNIVPQGLGKKNRLVTLDIPRQIPPDDALIRRSIVDKCQTMLQPPVSLLGIPGMRKLARDLPGWQDELGNDGSAECLLQVREYLNTPPDLRGDHLTAARDLTITFLQEAGRMIGIDFDVPISHFQEIMALIPRLARLIRQGHLAKAGEMIAQIADMETRAYTELSGMVS